MAPQEKEKGSDVKDSPSSCDEPESTSESRHEGNGALAEPPVVEKREGKSTESGREKPLKIHGTLNDVLRATMRGKPKPKK